jgi:hypothetical protein
MMKPFVFHISSQNIFENLIMPVVILMSLHLCLLVNIGKHWAGISNRYTNNMQMKVISWQLQRRQADNLVWEQTCTSLLHCWTVTEKNMKLFQWMNSLKRQMALLVYFLVFESSACLMKI